MWGGRGGLGGYPGRVGMKRLRLLMLQYGPDALQLLEDYSTEVGWHATFESICQLSGCCYDPILGCDVRVGDIFVFIEHRVQYLCGPGVLHSHYP